MVNDWARGTPWLHGLITWYAGTGAMLFAGLLIVGWWFARRGAGPRRMAIAIWAALAAVIAVGVNQPLVGVVREQRPYVVLPHALLLVRTLGGFLLPLRPRHDGRRGRGRTAAALMAPRTARQPAALLMAFSHVSRAPPAARCAGGPRPGATVAVIGYFLLVPLLTRLVARLAGTRLRPLLAAVPASDGAPSTPDPAPIS